MLSRLSRRARARPGAPKAKWALDPESATVPLREPLAEGPSPRPLGRSPPPAGMDSPLHAACITGDLEGLRGMLKGSYSSANDPDAAMGWTPLHFAAKFGRLDIVSALLEPPEKAYTPALVDPATPDGQTPLHMACAAGHEGVVRELLVHGASAARQENQLGYTALHFAASQARAALVGLLVQHGADGTTPPHTQAALSV